MKLLGIDTTGQTLSAAVNEDGRLLAEIYLDAGKKHSATLMTAIDNVLKMSECEIAEIDVFAAAVGPGSFTGIRIGTAACAAMAYAAKKPTAAVNTLDALIENAGKTNYTVCAIMDARRGEVYAKAKRADEVSVQECAVPLITLLDDLLPAGCTVFVGDAAERFADIILEHRAESVFLPQQFTLQRAASVCAVAYRQYLQGKLLKHDELCPHYLRESQAERLKRVENIK
ncbi:MAG: tRNA (adenosine(37)-N6)-threonylcarbamoyltransferase complex dimerization subunit type 1 TsaB [Christensenella sp.]